MVVPLAPLLMAVQFCAGVAAHEQPLVVVTSKYALPPEEPTLADAGDRL